MPLPSGELTNENVAKNMRADLSARVQRIRMDGILPRLQILSANIKNAPSNQYAWAQSLEAGGLGLRADVIKTDSAEKLLGRVETSRNTPDTCGIVLLTPFMEHEKDLLPVVADMIPPVLDIDGARGHDGPHPAATPTGIIKFIEGNGIDPSQVQFCLAGKGKSVNAPLYHMLSEGGAEVTAFDVDTPEHERLEALHRADVIVAAIGIANVITPALFTPEALRKPHVLINVGLSQSPDGKVVGDVSDEMRVAALEHGWGVATAEKDKGINTMTVLSLMQNAVRAAEQKFNIAA